MTPHRSTLPPPAQRTISRQMQKKKRIKLDRIRESDKKDKMKETGKKNNNK